MEKIRDLTSPLDFKNNYKLHLNHENMSRYQKYIKISYYRPKTIWKKKRFSTFKLLGSYLFLLTI